MGNVLELKENGRVLATTSFNVISIKHSIWVDAFDKELKQEEGYTQTAFYGEELKFKVETEGAKDGTVFEAEIKAKNDEGEDVSLEEDERQPFIFEAKIKADTVVFESIYLNPKWFDKETPITYVIAVKIKGRERYTAENLPSVAEHQLKPIGFGKPDVFKIDAKKGYLLEKQKNGSKIAFVSGKRSEIEMYQHWFENEVKELDFTNKKQVNSYFKSVYGFRPYGWAPNGEFGSEEKLQKVIDVFETVGAKHNVPPSVLWTIAVGEGLISIYKNHMNNDITIPVNSYQAFGLDFFGDTSYLNTLYSEGYLNRNYKSGGYANTGDYDVIYEGTFPSSASFMNIREIDGSKCIRDEAGFNTEIYPVWFKDMESAVIGCSAVYARSYDLATKQATSLGWKSLNLNQNVYYAYYKVQYPNRKLAHYNNSSEDFLIESENINRNFQVPRKSYERWVTWRYVVLSNQFSK